MRQRTPFQRIGVPEAKSLIDRKGVLLLDVRDAEAFRRSHIAMAQNVSITNLDTILHATARSMSCRSESSPLECAGRIHWK
jgi:rhodanese-related sulfurtransferase